MRLSGSIFTDDATAAPYWWEAAPREDASAVAIPKKADVAIVGAGFTGLSAALELARRGRSVVVLEAETPGFGASSRNGGMIGSGHRVTWTSLKAEYGPKKARAVLREGMNALDFASGLIEAEGLDCDYRRSGRFRGAWTAADYEAMARDIEATRAETGLEAQMISRAEQSAHVAVPAYHGGAVYERHGGLHPAKFHRELLRLAREAGAVVAGGAPVHQIATAVSGETTVATKRGAVRARDVIVATNGYTNAHRGAFDRGLRRRLIPIPSFLIATEPLGENRVRALFPSGAMIVETRASHLYYRPSPDGTRVIMGGRAALHPISAEEGAARMRDHLTGLFPDLSDVRISHSWTGFVAFTRHALPSIGRHRGVHYALGYNGSGVAMAPWLGHQVARQLMGEADGRTAFDDLAFRALPLYGGDPWFMPAVTAWWRLKDRMSGVT